MKQTIRCILVLCCTACLAACSAQQPATQTPPVAAEAVGSAENEAAPALEEPPQAQQKAGFPASFSTVDIYGNSADQSIFADYDLTMVNIWATYCGPCIMEMPNLGEMSAETPPGTQIIGLVLDGLSMEYVELARSIAEETGADFTHLIPDEELFNYAYDNIVGVPTTVFVDAQGKLVGEPLIGAQARLVYEAELKKRLDQLSGETSADDAETEIAP